MLALLFGFPWEERHKLAYWADWAGDLGAACDKGRARRRVEILWECGAVFLTLRKLREREAAGPDLISLMSHAQGTRELSPQEYLGNLILLIVGAIDTTRSTLNALPLANALWPVEWEKLRADSSLIPHWAQELIRWQTPLAHMRRTATRDCELGGHRIRAGDKVALWYWSANRDERVFEDAERFQPDRPNVRAHLAFGSGIHRCVGARLAELQISVLLEALLEQRLQPTAAGEVERNGNCFSNGYTKMVARLARS
jgi:cytochrome P450